jgi:hypothetical protein
MCDWPIPPGKLRAEEDEHDVSASSTSLISVVYLLDK